MKGKYTFKVTDIKVAGKVCILDANAEASKSVTVGADGKITGSKEVITLTVSEGNATLTADMIEYTK